jgi:two-component system response regulator FixJ
LVTDIPLSVCVVDDDDAVRDSLGLLLKAHGMTVHTYNAADRFLSMISKVEADCLIFDLNMPEMTGLELAERVRAMHMATPIVIVTGHTDHFLSRRMERAGISAVLEKPVSDAELLGAIALARSTRVPSAGCRG